MARRDIKAGSAYVELYTKNSRFQRGLSEASKQLRQFAADVGAMGQALVTASAAMLIPVALSTKRFAEFDDKMREVKAVSQSTGAEFAKLTAQAKHLGASTSFTAVQVAGLMAELGRAGFSAAQIDKMTESVLNLARATSTDATMASGIMAASIRQFGLEAEDAARVSDALTVAANKSFNTVESLGESLSYAGPVAADFNMSIEETLAVLGALGNVGIQGSNAGTAVRRLLTLTGAEAKKLNEIFGVEFQDASQNARPLVDVMEDINNATKDLGTGARASKFNEAFGLLGITGASAISKNTVSVRELMTALEDADGVAAATAKEMDAGLGGTLRILYSAIEGVAIGIGDALAPELQKLGAWVTELAGDTLAWITANKETIVTMVKVAAGIGAVGAALMALAAIASGAAMALGLIAALASPLGLVVIALAAIVGTAVGMAILTRSTLDLADAMGKLREQGDQERASALATADRLKALSEQQSLTRQEMAEAGSIIDQLNEKYGELGFKIDENTGKLVTNADAFAALDSAMRKQSMKEVSSEITEATENIRKMESERKRLLNGDDAVWFGVDEEKVAEVTQAMVKQQAALEDLKKRHTDLGNEEAQYEVARLNREAGRDVPLPGTDRDNITGGAESDKKKKGKNESTATRIEEDKAALEEAMKSAEERQKRLDDIEEQIAAKRRKRHEQEIYEIQQIAKERRKLLDQQGGSAGEYLQVDADAAFDIAEVNRKHQKESADEAKRKADEQRKAARDAQAEIDSLKVDLDGSLSEQEKALAKLEIDKNKETSEAMAAGQDVQLVLQKFDLLRQTLQQGKQAAAGGSQESISGTFSAAAAEAQNRMGESIQVKQAKTLEEIRKALREQYEEQKRQRRARSRFKP